MALDLVRIARFACQGTRLAVVSGNPPRFYDVTARVALVDELQVQLALGRCAERTDQASAASSIAPIAAKRAPGPVWWVAASRD